MTQTCYYCGPTDKDLRPYGPGGSAICYPCMKANPERERLAGAAFGALLAAAGEMSPDGVVRIGDAQGPQPMVIDQDI